MGGRDSRAGEWVMLMIMSLVATMAFMLVQRQRDVTVTQKLEGMRVADLQMTVLRLVKPVRIRDRHHRLGQYHHGQQDGKAVSYAG